MNGGAVDNLRYRLHCSVAQIDDIFEDSLSEAQELLNKRGIELWLDGTSKVCALGRGQDLPVIYLQVMPGVARIAGNEILDDTVEMCQFLSRSGNAKAIAPFLTSLPSVVRRIETRELAGAYFDLLKRIGQEASSGLQPFFNQVSHVLAQLNIGGLRNWVAYGLRTYREQPERAGDFFSLQTADSIAALQRERKGTLLIDNARNLQLYLHSFWEMDIDLLPFSTAYDIDRTPLPHLDKSGFHLPDVIEAGDEPKGIDRYRAILAHLAAHRRWTTPIIADNYNRFQHMIIEALEDSRVEYLAMQQYPGLRNLWLKLHPVPEEDECPPGYSCVRHKAALLSRAILDPNHTYKDPLLLEYVQLFYERVEKNPYDTKIATDLGVKYLVKIHDVSFRSPDVYFRNTEIPYRDDNRYLWIFLEDSDEEDDFRSDHNAANPKDKENTIDSRAIFARHHPEWDYESSSYRFDWATVYETPPETGNPDLIDQIFEENAPLANRLQRLIDMLKPQGRVRVRYQEDGAELDLDVAIRAMVDYRSGITPDDRIHQINVPDERDISVLLLIDLSQSINEPLTSVSSENKGETEKSGVDSKNVTILDLSREAAALLGWSLDTLGDSFSIAGFASNGRHEIRYFPFKGFTESWDDDVKSRIAGMKGALSTRMGASMRHAGHYLSLRSTEKKILLLLTDGEPSDVDVDDSEYLHADARRAVEELSAKGISVFCISLDPKADEYVRSIFGSQYLVLDSIEKLPEQLPLLYMALTR